MRPYDEDAPGGIVRGVFNKRVENVAKQPLIPVQPKVAIPFSHTTGEKGERRPVAPFTWERGRTLCVRGEGFLNTFMPFATLHVVTRPLA